MSSASSSAVLSLPTLQSTTGTSASSAAPTNTSTSSTTTTSNAATSTRASTSSESSTSSTSSSSTTSSQSSSTQSSASAFTTAQVITSGGSVVTVTSTVAGPTPTSTAQNNTSSSHSFFSNTGAVAGVFTVVGLIVAVLIIALIINAVRRRRAQKFDRDVAEAAAEAAAMSRAPFDDYSYGTSGGNGAGAGAGYGYSDGSHGTYQLPPLPPHNETYGMTEMSQYDPYAAGAASLAASAVARSRSRKDSEPGAPGIAGVGAGTLVREPSKRAPYHAFAGPGSQPHELQASNGTFRSRRSNQDALEAAGLAAAAGATNGAYVARHPSDAAQTTLSGRSKYGSMSSGGHHPAPLQPGYPVDSYYPHRNDSLSPDPFAGYPPVQPQSAPAQPLPNPHEASVPSSPLAERQSEHDDSGDAGSPTALRSEEQRMSYSDDADYSQGHRVLRVANE